MRSFRRPSVLARPKSEAGAGLFASRSERDLATAISRLAYCNPFTRERLVLERQVLGDGFIPFDIVWHAQIDPAGDNPNLPAITDCACNLAQRLRSRFFAVRAPAVSAEDLELYRDVVLYLLFNHYQARLLEAIGIQETNGAQASFGFYRQFLTDFDHYFAPAPAGPARPDPAHLFACCFQIRRAFHFTLRSIIGSSLPAARLREQIWQSIFTHDLRRYQRVLYRTLSDVTTLVTGASGTGKELVARTIGHSRYIPFEPQALRFRESWSTSFFPLDLSALSPTLIESELFGHRRGSFTGAVADRAGWLELCPPLGTVFLDEIGEIEPAIQVKLLRVLETRSFQRLGETHSRAFQGKVVAATNRDLAREMREGRFRLDLYYRLCSDLLTTPTLAERIAAAPDELSNLIRFLVQRMVGQELMEEVAAEVETCISTHLGRDYSWPGNVRELAQCVNNVLIRMEYRPASGGATRPRERLAAELLGGSLTADELLRRYCTLVYAQAGSYEEAGRRLGLDRRTVRSHIDRELLAGLRG